MYDLFSIFIFQEFGPVDKLPSGTRRLFPTLCSGTAPTTEHVYVPNHARGLVDYSPCYARRLCRPPSTFTFPTTLGDLSTGPYAVLGNYTDHRACLHSQPCSGTRQSLPSLCSGFTSITLQPRLGDCCSQLHMNWTHIQLRGNFTF